MGRGRKVIDKSLPPAEHIDDKQLRLAEAEIRDRTGNMPELDLHGQTAADAVLIIQNFVGQMSASGESCCRIVHGKGTGVLQKVVDKEIKTFLSQGAIEAYFQSQKFPGAAIVVIFGP